MTVDEVIGTLALVLGVGLVARVAADALRLPSMLLLVGAGAALGPHALGLVDVPLRSDGAQVLLTLGVAFILFQGGLNLSIRVLRSTAVGLFLLVVPGVVLTAAIVGSVAGGAFAVPLLTGLMIGAALASTDPAILIPLFEQLRLRPRSRRRSWLSRRSTIPPAPCSRSPWRAQSSAQRPRSASRPSTSPPTWGSRP